MSSVSEMQKMIDILQMQIAMKMIQTPAHVSDDATDDDVFNNAIVPAAHKTITAAADTSSRNWEMVEVDMTRGGASKAKAVEPPTHVVAPLTTPPKSKEAPASDAHSDLNVHVKAFAKTVVRPDVYDANAKFIGGWLTEMDRVGPCIKYQGTERGTTKPNGKWSASRSTMLTLVEDARVCVVAKTLNKHLTPAAVKTAQFKVKANHAEVPAESSDQLRAAIQKANADETLKLQVSWAKASVRHLALAAKAERRGLRGVEVAAEDLLRIVDVSKGRSDFEQLIRKDVVGVDTLTDMDLMCAVLVKLVQEAQQME
jgi:hypothetical protein